MTFVDVFIFFFLLFLLYLSFTSGILKVLTLIIGMYLGLQVAGLFYKIFGGITANPASSTSVITNQIVWFFILWIVWTIIFSLVAWSFLRHFNLPKWAKNIDQLGGLVLGVFASVFAVLVMGFVFKNVITMLWYGSGTPSNWLLAVKTGFEDSLLMRIFGSLKVLYLNVLSPWLPNQELPVFRDNPLG